MDKEIVKKYEQILNRSFVRDLSIYLFKCFIECNSSTSYITVNYNQFKPDEALIKAYIAIHQLSKETDIIEGTEYSVGEFDRFINKWFEENSKLLKSLKNDFTKRFLPLQELINFYSSTEKKCFYCDISEEDIKFLLYKKQIYSKALFNRGRSLEIDRKSSIKGYEKGNIVFCCYWCNNAKTDEFSENEFKPVGEQIKLIWKERLRKTS